MDPDDTPVTIPDDEPTVAKAIPELVHVPLPESDNVSLASTHTDDAPVIAEGNGFTVTTVVAEQPVAARYVIVAVPAESPETIPLVPIVAVAGVLLLHVPPTVPSLNAVVEPSQTLVVPVITAGEACTVTVTLWLQPVLSV